MDSKAFDRAASIVEHSTLAQASGRALRALRSAADRSFAARVWRKANAAIAGVPAAERVRLTGVVILTATLTNALLLPLVPSMAQPHAPWLRIQLLALGLALVVLATPIVRGWNASHARRAMARLRDRCPHA